MKKPGKVEEDEGHPEDEEDADYSNTCGLRYKYTLYILYMQIADKYIFIAILYAVHTVMGVLRGGKYVASFSQII